MVVAIGEPLIAPLSGRPCVFYETRMERTIGLGVSSWDLEFEVASEKRCVPFGASQSPDARRARALAGDRVRTLSP